MGQLLFKGTLHSSWVRKMNKIFLFKQQNSKKRDNTGPPCFVQESTQEGLICWKEAVAFLWGLFLFTIMSLESTVRTGLKILLAGLPWPFFFVVWGQLEALLQLIFLVFVWSAYWSSSHLNSINRNPALIYLPSWVSAGASGGGLQPVTQCPRSSLRSEFTTLGVSTQRKRRNYQGSLSLTLCDCGCLITQ